ncbi:MAG: MFS transporter [Candidatus Heimdallarchaeota archaeon]
MNDAEEIAPEEKKKRIQLLLTRLLAVSNSSGQQFYFNYGTLLAIGIGATTIQMSFITAIQNLGSSLFQGVFGRFSDKVGRRIILLLGFIIATITTFTLSFMTSPLVFMIIIGIYSIGMSLIIPAWNALLGDISTEKTRTRLIGKMSMIGTIGSSIILLILGSFSDLLPWKLANHIPITITSYSPHNLDSYLSIKFLEKLPWRLADKYRIMLLFSAFIFALATIIIILLQETNKQTGERKSGSFFQTFKDKNFSVLLGITSIWWFIMSFLWPIGPYVTANVNPTNFQVALLSVAFALAMAVGQWTCGRIADKIGRRFTAFIGFVFLSFVPLTLAYAHTWQIIVIANTIAGIGNGLTFVSLGSEVLSLAKPELKGTYTGTYNLSMGITTFVGSFAGGIIFSTMLKSFDYNWAIKVFLLSLAAARMLAAIPTLLLSRRENRAEK